MTPRYPTSFPLARRDVLHRDVLHRDEELPSRDCNFRDLGGHTTTTDCLVRPGLVYRSAALDDLSRQEFAQLGVKTVVDLRAPHEYPSTNPSWTGSHRAPTVVRLPMWGDGEFHVPMADRLLGLDRPSDVELSADPERVAMASASLATTREEFLTAYADAKVAAYLSLVRHHAEGFASLLTTLARPEHLPAVFHCAAGKDRTGIAAMLLLSVLGVPDEAVIRDYERSRQHVSARYLDRYQARLDALGVGREEFAFLHGAYVPAIQSARREAEAMAGTVEDYLLGPGSLDPEVLPELRAVFLVCPHDVPTHGRSDALTAVVHQSSSPDPQGVLAQ